MGTMSLLLGLLIGVIAGAMIAIWWSRGKGNAAASLLAQQLQHADSELRTIRNEVNLLTGSLATETEKVKNLTSQLGDREQQQETMTNLFKAIAGDLLESKGKQLTLEQQEKLNALLDPFKERIKEFQDQVKMAYEREGRERHSLKDQITELVKQNQQLREGAENLTKALKGDSKTQGDWGEMVLERMLESSGLVEGEEYTLQTSTTLDDGSRLRPDAVVHLPADKHIVIDSKVSLTHYERYVASDDETEREQLARAHVDSMRAHVKGLAQKDYPQLYGVNSPEFVFMFVPIDAAFNLAQMTRPEIVAEAIEQRVFIVTHGNLMPSLKLFHSIWKNERIARNHQEIAERAGMLIDKFVGFTEDLGRIGKQLIGAQESYEAAVKKLSEGSGNLVGQAKKLQDLGARSTKAIHPKLLERAFDPAEASEP